MIISSARALELNLPIVRLQSQTPTAPVEARRALHPIEITNIQTNIPSPIIIRSIGQNVWKLITAPLVFPNHVILKEERTKVSLRVALATINFAAFTMAIAYKTPKIEVVVLSCLALSLPSTMLALGTLNTLVGTIATINSIATNPITSLGYAMISLTVSFAAIKAHNAFSFGVLETLYDRVRS